MRRALIGYSGFVGSNLREQMEFSALYNSKNIDEIRGCHFDEVVCAGVQAKKWWANQNPEQDWAGIVALLDPLGQVTADHFVLISTVDVYAKPIAVTEHSDIATAGLHPYGLHRFKVEQWARDRFASHTVVRLPGLFGQGLKKNLIFDVLSGKDLSGFDARSEFQFYDLARIGSDVDIARNSGVPLVNFAVEPVSVASVMQRLTGQSFEQHAEQPPIYYDMRTAHAALWGQSGDYLQSRDDCLSGIERFADAWKRSVLAAEHA